jgi:hypothetical protein
MLSEVRRLHHDFSLAIAIQGAAWLEYHNQDPQQVLIHAEELEALSIKMGFPFYRGVAALFIGWARHKIHNDCEAAEIVDYGYHNWLASSGDKIAYSLYCTILGEIYVDTQYRLQAQGLLEQGIRFAIAHQEACYLPEMYRLLSCCLDGEHREHCLRQGLHYTAESPLFAARINQMLDDRL